MVQMQCSFKGKENLQDKTRPEYLVGIYIQKRVQKNSNECCVKMHENPKHKELEFKHFKLQQLVKQLQIKFQSARKQLEIMLQVSGD